MSRRMRCSGTVASLLRALCSWNAALVGIDAETDRRRNRNLDLSVLAALGLGILALTIGMSRIRVLSEHPKAFLGIMLAQLTCYGLAAGWVIYRKPAARSALAIVLLVALAARLILVFQPPVASTDIYRYVWDGRIQSHGINPYRYAPDDPALARYQDAAIYRHLNRKGALTIYPPVAQTVFRIIYLLHPDSVSWTKFVFSLIDLLNIGLLVGLLLRLNLRPERSLLYAWHPLMILEVGHSGHVDVVAICFLLLAVRMRLCGRFIWSGVLLACASLVKFYAVVTLPALLRPERRHDLRLPGALVPTALLVYLPFLSVGRAVFGYLPGYVQEEGVASGQRFYLLQQFERLAAAWHLTWPHWLGGTLLSAAERYQAFVVVTMLALGLGCWLWPQSGPRDIPNRALLLLIAFLVLTSPAYPWYWLLALSLIPLATARLLLPASVIVGTAFFLYFHVWWPNSGAWPADLGYGVGIAALVLSIIVAWSRQTLNRQRLLPLVARFRPRAPFP